MTKNSRIIKKKIEKFFIRKPTRTFRYQSLIEKKDEEEEELQIQLK